LVVINFAVITKGAGLIAEVAARFTLDAMPGKQLAIDADLNSGLVTEKDARARRRAIEEEADFYGAMDGASKFVRGDAVAGLVITAINILGGFFIGVVQQGADVKTAAETYTILTIGDDLNSGLVTEKDARARRRAIEEEADFYGAMDGASKFVRGDAVAGLVITAINILGGFFIGVVQQGADVKTAAETYTILTIGD